MSGLGERVDRVVEASVIGTLLASVSESRLVGSLQAVGARLAHMARHSFLFRWLTKEPEPAVIVIDLRETWTVGPIIQLLDWMIGRIAPYWEGSALKHGGDGIVTFVERAAETRTGQLLTRILTPPATTESPEREAEP